LCLVEGYCLCQCRVNVLGRQYILLDIWSFHSKTKYCKGFFPPVSNLTNSIMPLSCFTPSFIFSCIHSDMTVVLKWALFICTNFWQGNRHFLSTFFYIFGTRRCTQGNPFHFCVYAKWMERPFENVLNISIIKIGHSITWLYFFQKSSWHFQF